MNDHPNNGAQELLQRIEKTAYFAHYSLLGEGNTRQHDWEKFGAKLTGLEKGLWNFFLLGHAHTAAETEKLLGKPALHFLQRHKLCKNAKGSLSMGNLRLVRYWGMPMFIERGLTALSFMGEDVKALLGILPRRTAGSCLSLFTAGGLEVMPLAATNMAISFRGTKADEHILQANLELNSAKQAPEAWHFSPNGAEAYDLIVGSPPWLFEPPGIKLPKFVAGGPDGLKNVRTFLKTASTKLRPDGMAVTAFAYFSELESQKMEDHLRAFLTPYGLNYNIAVASKLLMEPGVPIFNLLVTLAVEGTKPPEMERIVKKIHETLRRKKFPAVHLLKGRFWKGAEGHPPEQQITNYSDSYYGTWTI